MANSTIEVPFALSPAEKLDITMFEAAEEKAYVANGNIKIAGNSYRVYLYKDKKNENSFRVVLSIPDPADPKKGELVTMMWMEKNAGFDQNSARPYLKGNVDKIFGKGEVVAFFKMVKITKGDNAGQEVGHLSFSWDKPREKKENETSKDIPF